jgi:hypothetical protein
MRSILITGLLVSMPTAALLAVAALALLVSNLRCRLLRALSCRSPKPSATCCAEPKGTPIATINADSPEHLAELLSARG